MRVGGEACGGVWNTDFLGNKRGRCRKCHECLSFSMHAMKINPTGKARG